VYAFVLSNIHTHYPSTTTHSIQNIVPDCMLWHNKLLHFVTRDPVVIMAQLQRTGVLNSSALRVSGV
jgi:hypothetical protein